MASLLSSRRSEKAKPGMGGNGDATRGGVGVSVSWGGTGGGEGWRGNGDVLYGLLDGLRELHAEAVKEKWEAGLVQIEDYGGFELKSEWSGREETSPRSLQDWSKETSRRMSWGAAGARSVSGSRRHRASDKGLLTPSFYSYSGQATGTFGNEKSAALVAVREYVVKMSMELSGELTNRFLDDVFSRLLQLTNSLDAADKYSGVLAASSLIPVQLGEEATKIQRLANCLREVLQSVSCDFVTLKAAAEALGQLVRVGGALTADIVEGEVRRALDWMASLDRIVSRRYCAALILEQMAANAPTIFNVHVPQFIDIVWLGLRDQSPLVRERVVLALRECLLVVEKRETRKRVQWYYKLFEETQKGMTKGSTVESIHGSLLTIGELLRHTGEFMLARYREVAEAVLRYRDHKDRTIRITVILLLPRVAIFSPERFTQSYLQITMTHLLSSAKLTTERPLAIISIGRLTKALQYGANSIQAFQQYFPHIAAQLTEVLSRGKRKEGGIGEALECVGTLAAAAGQYWRPHCEALLDAVFACGLSDTLADALIRIVKALPTTAALIHTRMLDMLSMVLTKKPFATVSGLETGNGKRSNYDAWSKYPPASLVDSSDTETVQLALRTLSRFQFSPHYGPYLLDMAQKVVVGFLEDTNVTIRREAALCCCSILEQYVTQDGSSSRHSGRKSGGSDTSDFVHNFFADPANQKSTPRSLRLPVSEIMERLVIVVVGDPEPEVRRDLLFALRPLPVFDEYLAQGDLLRSLFLTLNDEDMQVRELSIALCGRLSSRNPAYVLPALRRQLMQLLTDLDHAIDGQYRQQSAKLLTCLIRAVPQVILPYVAPLIKALTAKLSEGGHLQGSNALPSSAVVTPSLLRQPSATNVANMGNMPTLSGGKSGLQVQILDCIACTARVGGQSLQPFLPELLPLVLDALRDGSTAGKREIAVRCLGMLIEYTGHVVTPYTEYPGLMGSLLNLLEEYSLKTRCEVMRVIGVIGALDPHAHKRNQVRLVRDGSGTTSSIEGGQLQYMQDSITGHPPGVAQAQPSSTSAELDDILPSGLATSSDEYYPSIAIRTLMRILRDNSLSSHHLMVVRSLMFIFQAQGLSCVHFLPRVMPALFHVLRTGEEPLREFILQQLTKLVAISKNHVRKYLPELQLIIREYWTTPNLLLPILKLIEQLCIVLQDEFRVYIPSLFPRMINFLVDAERADDLNTAMAVLHTIEVVGMHAENSIHMVIPTLTRLMSPKGTNRGLQRGAIRSLSRLIPRMQMSAHSSMIVQVLCRVMKSPREELRKDAGDVLYVIAQSMGTEFLVFWPVVRNTMAKYSITHRNLEATVARIVSGSTVIEQSAIKEEVNNDETDIAPGIRLHVNQKSLRRAWDSGQRSTKEDWTEWMRHLSVELLKESPSPALRACCSIAQLQPHVARELFPAGFVSCWSELHEGYQEQLVRSLETAFAAPTIPPEIVATLLNLAEFMEHDEKPLPLEMKTLGALAEKCHAYAKALYYKEQEFQTDPEACIEKLIHINNQLTLPEAASGMLAYAQKHLQVELKENLYEKLQRWPYALEAYRRKLESTNSPAGKLSAHLGIMRCLNAMSEWGELSEVCAVTWELAAGDNEVMGEVAPIAAQAAWKMGDWGSLDQFTDILSQDTTQTGTSSFYKAILDIHNRKFTSARKQISVARDFLAMELPALAGESYERAYPDMIRVQQLTELEEVIEYSLADTEGVANCVLAEVRRSQLRQMWRDRLMGVQRSMSVWQQLLSIRHLVVPMHEDPMPWEKYANLCLKSGSPKQGRITLIQLLGYDPSQIPLQQPLPITGSHQPSVLLTYLKHLYAAGDRTQAFARLEELTQLLREGGCGPMTATEDAYGRVPLLARAFLKLGQWRWALASEMSDTVIVDVLTSLRAATDVSMSWGKAWHTWALFNISAMDYYMNTARNQSAAARHVAPAVTGFFRSIALSSTDRRGGTSEYLQDILRLLTLWFTHGAAPDVENAIKEGISQISIDTWLAVIPQLIARIHTNSIPVRNLLHTLLVRIGREHPQELIYPLLVACQSQSTSRRAAAETILNHMRQQSSRLVEQAQLVSEELIRVAILWHELWHEALEEASRLYFGEHDVEGMLNTLAPLHEKLERTGPETLNETAFLQAYGRELAEASEWCRKYQTSRNMADLNQAWDLYYQVFKKINKQLPSLTTLELQYVSPALVNANGIELAVPGTHAPGEPVITIASFAPQLQVITSKQRPRKLTIIGSNGAEYSYLLKGHEDLRQDERVMQLFGLVNSLLGQNRATEERNLNIARYAVIPLSPNSGLIGWVPHCDTFHSLIREYREVRKIALNLEHRLMLAMAPDFDQLPLINKLEVFQHALDSTAGNDLEKVIWLKSRNSEVWLDRRTNFTRSLAVMSMVGYLLGLGDRHPSNLMMDRYSGKVLHIDFGDCFEASMNREKYPEKVPFRLTRMLVKAMEVCGTEGTFRATCESVLKVMRSNKDSVMAMLEAFVHDPLINWRLIAGAQPNVDGEGVQRADDVDNVISQQEGLSDVIRATAEADSANVDYGALANKVGSVEFFEGANEVLNDRAVAVMQRMSHKLTGRDGGGHDSGPTDHVDGVPAQVQRLIDQATSHENLCQSYIGWCPFW